MKTKMCISFRAENIPGEAATILEPTSCGPDVAKVADYSMFGVRDISVTIELDELDERVPKVLALLQQYGVEVKSFLYDEYSEEDLQTARLLWMGPDANVHAHAGHSLGTKYDLTKACPNCHTGAVQTSPLYVNDRALKSIRSHRALMASNGDIILDGGMRKKLVDAGITGISFGDVRVRHENNKWSEVARDQILIEHIMPPMRGPLTADDENYMCKVCRRGGRMSSPEVPYREEDLVGMQDFNLTWEWFGEFGPPDHLRLERRSSPCTLVTPKVMNIFNKAGVKAFDWTPVNVAA
jgi:hypothetical protein